MSGEFSKLKGWGADPEDAIARLLGDEQLYRRLLLDFGENSEIELLQLLINQENFPEAFRIAHSMKGASVSLGLDPLTGALSELVEYLRPYYDRFRAANGEAPDDDSEGDVRHGCGSADASGVRTHDHSGLTEKSRIRFCAKQVDRVWAEYCRIVLQTDDRL